MRAQPRQAGLLDVVKTVLWGLVGIRRRADAESVRVRPLQIIVAAVVLVALLVATLLAIVRVVTG